MERKTAPLPTGMDNAPGSSGEKRTLLAVKLAAIQVKRSQSVTYRNWIRAVVTRKRRKTLKRRRQTVNGSEFRAGGRPSRPSTPAPRWIASTPKTAKIRPKGTCSPDPASRAAAARLPEKVIRRMAGTA